MILIVSKLYTDSDRSVKFCLFSKMNFIAIALISVMGMLLSVGRRVIKVGLGRQRGKKSNPIILLTKFTFLKRKDRMISTVFVMG